MSKTFVTSLVVGCLATCVTISLSVFCFTRSKRIRLPTTDEDSNSDLAEASRPDPFDIAKPGEVVDGTPPDEDKFWAKIRKRKIIQTLVLSLGLVLACGELGLYLRTGRTEETTEIPSLLMEVVLLAYLVLLLSVSISKTDVPAHWSYVVHSSALSAIGFFFYTLAQVLPTGPRLETSSTDISSVGHVLHYLVIGTLGITTSIGVTIPRAPKLYFPPELVYQLNTLDLSAPKNRDNVVQEPHASIASFLFFNYVTPVVMLGYYAESLEIRDLPILTARLRSPLIFSQMRAVVRNVRLPAWLGIKSGSGYQLIYHLLVVNKRAFLLQIALSVVIAGLYYVPAWFIKQFVYFLELTRGSNRIHDIDVGWG
ncbi:hypothetical protein FRC12_023789 [Ceratobasidium sp. 428]|nr:hypothetical protein FRC12_023789 [Ceratobasidium sp. 428]